MVKEAREHLEKYGFVFTLRPSMRKGKGKDWYNHFRGDTKKGDVEIVYMGSIDDYPLLQNYYQGSGFKTREDWLKAAKGSKYLYFVGIIS